MYKYSRIIKEADYIIENNETIRKAAKVFNLSKSTIHKDIHNILKKIDYEKYMKVQEIFNKHIELRHILGGNSTKLKYQKR